MYYLYAYIRHIQKEYLRDTTTVALLCVLYRVSICLLRSTWKRTERSFALGSLNQRKYEWCPDQLGLTHSQFTVCTSSVKWTYPKPKPETGLFTPNNVVFVSTGDLISRVVHHVLESKSFPTLAPPPILCMCGESFVQGPNVS